MAAAAPTQQENQAPAAGAAGGIAHQPLSETDAWLLGPASSPSAGPDPTAIADPLRPATAFDRAPIPPGSPALTPQGSLDPTRVADPLRPLSDVDRQLFARYPNVPPLVRHEEAVSPPGAASGAAKVTPPGAPAGGVTTAAAVPGTPAQGSLLGRALSTAAAVGAAGLSALEVPLKAAQPLFRFLSALANPVHGAIQTGVERASGAVARHPGESDAAAWLEGLQSFFSGVTSPEAGRAAWSAFISPDIKLNDPFSAAGWRGRPLGAGGGAAAGALGGGEIGLLVGGPGGALVGAGVGAVAGSAAGLSGIRPGSTTDKWVRGLGNFAFNLLIDELTGKAQGPMTAQLLRVAHRAGELSGLHDVPIPLPAAVGGPKSLNRLRTEWATNKRVAQIMAKHEGLQVPVQEAAIAATERANAAYERLDRLGVPLAGKGARGQRINTLDEFAYYWIEAGTTGAAYKSRAEVEQAAARLSQQPAVQKEIVGALREIGGSYASAWRTVGESLEKAGYLKPGTVARMGGHYAARMYEATSHNPDDIEAWLRYADEAALTHPQAGVAEGARRNAEAIIGKAGERGGVAVSAKARHLETPEERAAHGAVLQASPVFGKSIRQQTRIAARAGAMGEIAQTPTLAEPGFFTTPGAPRFTSADEEAAGAAAAERLAALKTANQHMDEAQGAVTARAKAALDPRLQPQQDAADQARAGYEAALATYRREKTPGNELAWRRARDEATLRRQELEQAQAALPRAGAAPAEPAAGAAAPGVAGLTGVGTPAGVVAAAAVDPLAAAVTSARDELATAEAALTAARRTYRQTGTAADQAALEQARAATNAARERTQGAIDALRRSRIKAGTPQEALVREREEAVPAAQRAQSQATQAYEAARTAYQQAATPENELAMLRAKDAAEEAAAAVPRAKRAYRESLTMSDGEVLRVRREGARDAAIQWQNAENRLGEIRNELKSGPPTVRTKRPPPPGTTRLVDRKYGPLNGMIVPNNVKKALDAYVNPAPVDEGFKKLISGLASFFKSQAMFLAFPSLFHKVKYDSVLAEGAAKEAGVGFSPVAVTSAARDLRRYRAGGAASPAIAALRDETRAFVPRDETLGALGGSLRNVLGLGGRNIPAKLMGAWRKAGKFVPETIGEIERTYKIALTEALAPKYGYPEAARRAAETIGDWTMTDPTIRVIEKYGGIPFLTARAKAFPKMLTIALKHPEVLQRWGHPQLGPSLAAASGPGSVQTLPATPPGAFPLPGTKDAEGREQWITRDPLRVEPFTDLASLGTGMLGVPGLVGGALSNVDWGRSFRGQEAQSIVKPGEQPPLDSDEARFRYVADRLQPGVVRSVGRISRAVEGKTKFGGPYAEPETLAQAILGVTLGADLTTPRTAVERQLDAARNLPQAGRAMAYAQGYLGELLSGRKTPRVFPLAERGLTTVADTKAAIKNAQARLKSIALGRQFQGQEQIDELKKQSEWLFTLHTIATRRLAEENQRAQAKRTP